MKKSVEITPRTYTYRFQAMEIVALLEKVLRDSPDVIPKGKAQLVFRTEPIPPEQTICLVITESAKEALQDVSGT